MIPSTAKAIVPSKIDLKSSMERFDLIHLYHEVGMIAH